MALHITNNQGIFEINGLLNATNTGLISNYFETIIDKEKMITISLDKVKDIDKVAVKCLGTLYKKAIVKNKIFYIIGSENKKVRDQFKEQKMFYVLRRDVF
ncbi:STAS domain-containing protein [Flavobacterium sp. TP390]|uniref:STAS domain-containing protein n=1 Tax=Flavobacterium profundi TaxID=1774945 RepID=A0A6I4IH29_9FLAO|nr:STAS domain-containing protein [Flavobacterium profundi]MVO08920.1 STAS domain-containing protein [Flavobacterium profundi]